ncbi:MAG: MarR family transcriptional regulator [Acidobacteria bacterium]|nr:MarR family transcriptional regulator [Acidobacteriota bacterium]
MNHSGTLETLLVSSTRLVRIAAQSTGSKTPSAVWRALGILDTEGPMRIGELATANRVTQPGMTRVIGTMVEEEYVSRIADVADSRAWLIRITPKGRAALEAWRHQIAAALAPWFADLDEGEWAILERAVELMATRTASDAAVSA